MSLTPDELPTGCVVFRVRTRVTGDPAGAASCIAVLPRGARDLPLPLFGAMLRRLSVDQARSVGEQLHSAEWTVTSDPAVVAIVGACAHPRCMKCRADVDQALALLRDHPATELLAGVLHWAPDGGGG